MRSSSVLLAAAGLIVGSTLSCGAQTAADTSGYATQSHTPQNFRLPEGAGCSGEVARWQAIQDNDYRGGNIGLPIYHRIQNEIAQAAAACSAGHDAQATAMIHASRSRHGYPQ